LLLGALLFFAIAPGMVAGVVPYFLTRWRFAAPLPGPPASVAGVAFVALGLLSLVESFARFVVEGWGTPAPVAPPRKLVVSGQYRYVRNPMYVAVIAIVGGQALLLGSGRLAAYAALLGLLFHAWVIGFEEPRLAAQFGQDYRNYRKNVGRWLTTLGHRAPRP
jgi:protein-S-isoprenylcysteine O-methyltransferase Ste14